MRKQPANLVTLLISLIIGLSLVPAAWIQAEARTITTTGSISGVVWHDSNANGIQEPSEASLKDHPVYLQRIGVEASGAIVAVTYTDAEGFFLFDNIELGEYRVFAERGADVRTSLVDVNAMATLNLPVVPLQTSRLFLPLAGR